MYSNVKAVDQSLQMQVQQELEKYKGSLSVAAPAALSAAPAMVTLSMTVTTKTKALALILSEDANCLVPLDLLTLPPRKMHRTSRQRQIDCQNNAEEQGGLRSGSGASYDAHCHREDAGKGEPHDAISVIVQVEREFKAHGFAVCSVARQTIDMSKMT